MTPSDIIFHRRVRVLKHAEEGGNVAATCRTFGISRKTFYEWKGVADRYGLDALLPKGRQAPQMPNATPTWIVNELFTMAVTRPTLGARRYADEIQQRGALIGKSTVQDILNRHGLGQRNQRLAKAAVIAAQTGGLMTEAARDEGPFGFCMWAGAPGEVVGCDSFFIGKLKGVGKVYQLTAVDTATRLAMVLIVLGPVRAELAGSFLHYLVRRWRRWGVKVRGVLTDNGPEWIAADLRAHLAKCKLVHHRIPPRSPNHNAVCERFHGIMLEECWRPAFHRRHFTSIRQLQAEADAWLHDYNTRRRNHGDFMKGRTPKQVLDSHKKKGAR